MSDRESWARLRLAQGESAISTMELSSSLGQTTLTIGQSTGGDWLVREEGVAPIHFSLHWDGSTLRIADVYGAGGVRVDGELVGAQWRVLSGRVRIDFGNAAIVVETGTVAPKDAAKDPTPLPRLGSGAPSAQSRASKATLLGVAPIDDPSWATGARAASSSQQPPSTPSTESFRPRRPDESVRPVKPTLLGLKSVMPPPAAPSKSSPTPTGRPIPKSSPPAGGSLKSGTLMGMGLDPAALAAAREAAQRSAAASSAREPTGSDKPASVWGTKTSPEYPAGSPERAPAHSSSTPSGLKPSASTARFGTVLHEVPEPRVSAAPGRDTLPEGAALEHPARSEGAPRAERSAPREELPAEPGFRYSDAPTVMRDPASLEPRRTKKAFSWRGVGVGMLTLAAYFAWLYLLDHL